ncbi:MAG: hypothetical protein JRI77_14755, partial [Deltaproteobacteria bacterium]|nr:hypothetical protein [Deltaproteobacteria bacterium]
MTAKENPSAEMAGGAKKKDEQPVTLKDTTVRANCQIPEEIRNLSHWLLWKSEPKSNGKITKVPYSITGGEARTNDPASWASFEDALNRY